MQETSKTSQHFSDLKLPQELLRALQAVGYETPTPIQSRTIPPLLEGRDVLGHAPTGTGKTAAFALPILARLDMQSKGVQVLVLTPTRELAIQVAEAFSRYAVQMKNFRVLPIYGGQDYTGQIRQLGRGVQVVVGTPGRVMDHMRRGTLKLNKLSTLVLDEADEMLRMGFIDDVEWVLEQIPPERQMALFSATMPSVIKRIAARHLNSPIEITIEGRLTTAKTIRQRYWMVSGLHKLDALTRILEAEPLDAMLVFVRTRTATVEVADRLAARGFAVAAMNGDMPQKQREQTVNKLKQGSLDILVATDVVARGLDVERISHVINYDIPHDTEAYVHRIGRTGRAGRSGDAILFVTPRERRLLGAIEKATRQKIEKLELPTIEMVNNRRLADFKQRIADTLATGELAFLQRVVEEFSMEHNVPGVRIAAALAKMSMGDQPLLLSSRGDKPAKERKARKRQKTADDADRSGAQVAGQKRTSATASQSGGDRLNEASSRKATPAKSAKSVPPSTETKQTPQEFSSERQQRASREKRTRSSGDNQIEMERFRVEVGEEHGVTASNIVGAIANEAGLDAEFIGRITIKKEHSTLDLPAGMPKFLLKDLKRVWVCNRQLGISRLIDGDGGSAKAKTADTQPKKPRQASKAKSKRKDHKKRKKNTKASGISS
ncbi:MAG: DEAD/DEAH box helicase [Granulosicoccus sp.]